ncbi:MAG: redox-regulated ATPase YchF [Christensenellaceae bacterium]|jgi:GTP-binding protein YchF|nr:redox-regulated ATPase YchF [Christensenellaceae bacterium]
MKLGIVGLPNVGKSTLFNAITKAGAEVANYPFCTILPNIGVVAVPDDRLYMLANLYNCKKIVHTNIEFVDIAGLVKDANKGEGLGNKFLSHIREVDAIIHVVRCFEDSNITHVNGSVDPLRDIEIINTELLLSDIEVLMRKIDRAKTQAKSGEKKYLNELEILQKLLAWLSAGKPARTIALSQEETEYVESLFLITWKKVIYCANISENENNDVKYTNIVSNYAKDDGSESIVICSRMEAELAELPDDERAILMEELSIEQSGLEKLISKSYRLLGLMSFLTAGEKETRAWTIPTNTKAPQAAGKIHSDFERGFIRAEVVNCELLLECGSYTVAKEKGKVRSEGKDYIVREGDVMLFRFNV